MISPWLKIVKIMFSESFGKVGFNKEAKELTYPSMDQAIEDYDEEHARGDPPTTVVCRRLTLVGNLFHKLIIEESSKNMFLDKRRSPDGMKTKKRLIKFNINQIRFCKCFTIYLSSSLSLSLYIRRIQSACV